MASLAAIFRQVEREGARWGLVPVMRDGCVKVCEMVAEIPQQAPGKITIPVKVPRVVCSLDENSPLDAFAAVLLHRLKREHHDFMKLVRARQERLRRQGQAELDLRRRDLRRKIETLARRRVITTGIAR